MRERVVAAIVNDAERELGLQDGFISKALQIVDEDGALPVQLEGEIDPVGRLLDVGKDGVAASEKATVLHLVSLGYRFPEALFVGTLFLPGALAAKFFFPKVVFKKRQSAIKDVIFITLGILIGEILLFLVAHYYITLLREGRVLPPELIPDIPHLLTNPFFVAVILTALAAGCYFFESWLERKRPSAPSWSTYPP